MRGLPDEGQAEPAAGAVRRPAAAEDLRGVGGPHARSVVRDAQQELPVAGEGGDRDPGAGRPGARALEGDARGSGARGARHRLRRRVHRVVDQIAEDGHQIAVRQCRGQGPVVDQAVVRQHQLHAPLVRLRGLAQQQRRQYRFRDRADDAVRQGLGQLQLRRGEADRLLLPAQLDQRDDRVQPVRRLVRLRAQRLGEPPLGVQLARKGLEFRVVAQGDHGAAPLPAHHRTGVDHDHPVRRQMHLVDPFLGGQQRSRERCGQIEFRDPAADRSGREPQQFAARVVDQGDPPLPVEHQQPLAHRVQGGLVVVVQPAQLGCVHPVGVPPQPRVDHVRAEAAERQRRARREPQRTELGPHLRGDPLDRDTRTDEADDPAVVPDRRHDPYRGAERAGVRLRERLAAQGPGGVPEEGLADPLGVRVGPADPVRVHDRDEGDPGVLADLLRVRLEHGRRVRGADRLPYRRRTGDRQRGRPHLPGRGLLGLAAAGDVREERAPRHHGGDQHHLHGEELAREAARAGTGETHPPSLPGRKPVTGRPPGVALP